MPERRPNPLGVLHTDARDPTGELIATATTNRRVDAVSWAQEQTRYDRPTLAAVENRLLKNERLNVERLRHGLRRPAPEKIARAVFWLLVTGPLWPLVLFAPSGQHWRTGNDNAYDARNAHLVAAVGFIAGATVLVILFLRWRRQSTPRLRDTASCLAGPGYAILAVATILRANARTGTFAGPYFSYLIPVWITLFLALATIYLQVKSQSNPVDQRFDVTSLADEDRAWLLEERAEALQVLADKGLLDSDVPLDELNARPLGQLHLPRGEAP